MPDRTASRSAVWSIVIPVKPAEQGKSRLGADADLVRAIAADTVEAVARAAGAARVLVVTSDARLPAMLAPVAGVEVVAEQHPTGISAALALGLSRLGDGVARAALLGDVPGLVPAELDAVLTAALEHDRAFLPDAEGTGTVLVTARAGVPLVQRFGRDSAERHRALGLAELAAPATSALRRDVDTPEQLRAAGVLGLGPRTRALLAASAAQRAGG